MDLSFGLGLGSQVLGGLMQYQGQMQSYKNQKAAVEYQRKLQDYNNKMVYLSAAMQQNTITTNVTNAIQQSAMQAVDIQKAVSDAVGETAVSAAATGTTGRSVDMAITNVERQGAAQEYVRQEQLQSVFDSADAQRQNVAMQAQLQQDLTWYQSPTKPSSTAAFLGIVGGVAGSLSAYNSRNQSTSEGTEKPSAPTEAAGGWSLGEIMSGLFK